MIFLFFGNQGQDLMMNPEDYATITSHNLKTGAILKKNELISPIKCY